MYYPGNWPRDPVNRAIVWWVLPACIGVGFAGYSMIYGYRWGHKIPTWLDLRMIFYPFAVGWIILDEWRSRRSGGTGHGWVWQTVQRLAPRRPFNRGMVIVLIVLIAAGQTIGYVDSNFEPNLRDSPLLFVADMLVTAPAAVWLAATLIRWGVLGRDGFNLIRAWRTALVCLAGLSIFLGLAGMSDAVGSVSGMGYALVFVMILVEFAVALIRWAIRSIARTNQDRQVAEADPTQPLIVPPAWW